MKHNLLIIEDDKIIEGDAELVIPQQWVISVTKLGESYANGRK